MSDQKPDELVSFASTEVAPPLNETLNPIVDENSIIKNFFSDLFAVCFSATRFFESKPVHTRPLGGALAFGISVEWISAAMSFLVGLSFSRLIEQYIQEIQAMIAQSGSGFSSQGSQILEMFRVNQMLYGIGMVILNPFFSLFAIYITAFFLFLGMKTFLPSSGTKVPAETFGFEGCVKLISYARATSIFAFIPFIGGLVAPLWRACVIIIGVKHSFGVSTTRASFVAYFYATLLTLLGFVTAIFLALTIWRMFSN